MLVMWPVCRQDGAGDGPARDSDSSDEEEVPIPDGWKAVEGMHTPFEQFLIWTRLTRSKREQAAWHRMVVLTVLQANRKDKYTHDAHVYGESSRDRFPPLVGIYITLFILSYIY